MDYRKVVIFIGPPGSGKDTQAFKLARKFGFFNFQTSATLKQYLSLLQPTDPERVEIEGLISHGELAPFAWVAKVVVQEVRKLVTQNPDISLVFSGSFRTLVEAEAEIPVMEELFGKSNVHIFFLQVSREESKRRNVGRKMCEAHSHPLPDLPGYQGVEICKYDGSKFVRRSLDEDPEIVAKRYDVYLRDTAPVIALFKEKGYEIVDINAEQSIADIHQEILQHLAGHPL